VITLPAQQNHFHDSARAQQLQEDAYRLKDAGHFSQANENLQEAIAILFSANQFAEASTIIRDQLSAPWISTAQRSHWHRYMGTVLHFMGDDETAVQHYHQALSLARDAGDKTSMMNAYQALGCATQKQDKEDAKTSFEYSLNIARELDD